MQFPLDNAFYLEQESVAPTSEGWLSSKTFVALHGWGGNLTQLQPIGQILSNRGAQMYYIALRGHGKSIRPKYGYSCLDNAADVLRVAVNIGSPINLIGYSFGGLVSAMCALTFPPNIIEKIVIIDESFDSHPEFFRDDESREARYFGWMFSWSHLLSKLSLPGLLLRASSSRMISEDEANRLSSLSMLKLDLIDGDHTSCLENKEIIADKITQFFCQ